MWQMIVFTQNSCFYANLRVKRDKIEKWCKKFSVPLVIGICRIGEQNVIDPTEIEEACASSSLFVSVVVPARNTVFITSYKI